MKKQNKEIGQNFLKKPMLHSHWQVYIFYTCLDTLQLLLHHNIIVQPRPASARKKTLLFGTGAEALSKIFSVPVLTEKIYTTFLRVSIIVRVQQGTFVIDDA